jgi:lysozyme
VKISQAGINLIKRFEGLQLKAYLCPAGVWTIGYGHTSGVHQGQEITETFANALLVEDLEQVAENVSLYFARIHLTQGQFDALCALRFNVGSLTKTAPSLCAKLLAGDVRGAANEFLDIDKDIHGVVQPGLAIRRQAERSLFLS